MRPSCSTPAKATRVKEALASSPTPTFMVPGTAPAHRMPLVQVASTSHIPSLKNSFNATSGVKLTSCPAPKVTSGTPSLSPATILSLELSEKIPVEHSESDCIFKSNRYDSYLSFGFLDPLVKQIDHLLKQYVQVSNSLGNCNILEYPTNETILFLVSVISYSCPHVEHTWKIRWRKTQNLYIVYDLL